MNPTSLILAALTLAAPFAGADSLAIYIGTNSGGDPASKGIYRSTIDLETGALTSPKLVAEAKNPSFIEFSPSGETLYAVARGQNGGAAHSYAVDPATGALTETSHQPCGKGPCHITVSPDGSAVLAADYGGGAAFSYPVSVDSTLGEASAAITFTGSGPNPQRQKNPHCHSALVSPSGSFAYFADLGTDLIMGYALGNDAALTPLDPPSTALKPGAGPRHMTFAPNGETIYAINELDGSMSVLSHDVTTGALTEIQTLSTLPADFDGGNKCAEVRVHPSGKFVYGSNRGHESIIVYKVEDEQGRLSYVEHEKEGIHWPRNFNLTPDGKWCLIANAKGHSVRVYEVDASTGALQATAHEIAIGKPMCLRFLSL